jgi:DNA-binding Xre family transcriptional regulator
VEKIRLKVREVIMQKNITQSKLSRIADVPLNTIQVLYHNPYHDPKLSTLYRLAKALGVTVNDLYEVVIEED